MRRKTNERKKLIKENDNMWSLIVRKKYEFTCQMCKWFGKNPKPFVNVQAHHIIGRANKSTRWDIDNGVALCYYHHRFYVHGGRLDPESLIEFYKWLLGEEKYKKLQAKKQQIVRFDLNFIRHSNQILRKQFEDMFGMTYEEFKKITYGGGDKYGF